MHEQCNKNYVFISSSLASLLFLNLNFSLLLDSALRHFTFHISLLKSIILLYWKKKGNQTKKTFAMCNVARIAMKSVKKRRNKKFGERITPIRYNAMYIQPVLMIHYRIAGNFRGVKIHSTRKTVIFVSKISFSLVAAPHSYVPVSHAYVKISWSPRK